LRVSTLCITDVVNIKAQGLGQVIETFQLELFQGFDHTGYTHDCSANNMGSNPGRQKTGIIIFFLAEN
jgi:hypothetical protein